MSFIPIFLNSEKYFKSSCYILNHKLKATKEETKRIQICMEFFKTYFTSSMSYSATLNLEYFNSLYEHHTFISSCFDEIGNMISDLNDESSNHIATQQILEQMVIYILVKEINNRKLYILAPINEGKIKNGNNFTKGQLLKTLDSKGIYCPDDLIEALEIYWEIKARNIIK